MKKIIVILLMLVAGDVFAAQVSKEIRTKILEKIGKTNPVCAACQYVFQQPKSSLIAKHKLYQVSTFDLMPPPSWTFAIDGKGEIFSLDIKNTDDWNKVMQGEKISLRKDGNVIEFAKFFISMTMAQSVFIDKLLPGEIKLVESKEKKKISATTKVVRSGQKIQILFYAKDMQGDLQQWNMILKSNGEIIKLQERSF